MIRLGAGRSIRGRVVDGNGKPVVGAIVIPEVRLTGTDRLGWRGKTDADRRFVWPNAPSEAITLKVVALGSGEFAEQRVGHADAAADVTIAVDYSKRLRHVIGGPFPFDP